MSERMDNDRAAAGSPRATLQQRLADARKGREPQPEERAHRGGTPRPSQAEKWGLTPGVTLVLIVVAGVAMVAGLILVVSAPSSQAAAPDVAAAVVAPTLLPAARPLAENAIEDYLLLIRQGMFDIAWGRTTARFQADNYPSGFAAYQQAWAGSAELEVVSKKVILHTDDQVNVVAEIHDLGSDTTYTNAYTLVFDGASGLWLIDAVNQIW
jgi:hypothetical protein